MRKWRRRGRIRNHRTALKLETSDCFSTNVRSAIPGSGIAGYRLSVLLEIKDGRL